MGNTQSSENATAGIVNKALAEVFRFIELCEEIRQSKQKGHSFVKVYDNVKKDWEQNHFLANTKDEPDRGKKDENPKTKASASSSQKKKKDTDEQFGVFVTSYQLKQWNEEKATFGEADGCDETLIVNKGENNSKFWLKIEEPIYRVPPSGTSSRWALQKCLTKLEAENPEMFERNAELSAELSRLKQENLAPPSSIADDEWQEANEYVNYLRKLSTQQKAAPLYKKLHQWIGREDQGASELALGFGHARMLVEDKDQCKMVNGPLFEVLVNAEWHEDHENGRRFIAVLPEDNVSVKLNVQVMDALMSDVGNKETLKRLNEWARQKEVGSLCPGNAQTFLSFLDTATKLRWNSNLRMSNDRGVHTFPEDPESLVLTAAWCLYSSSKKSSTFSRDAALLAKALDKGAVNITTGRELDKGAMIAPSAVFPLILGPDALEDGEANSIQLDELPLPLPATPSQKKVVEKLFENDHVLVVDGPPG